MFGAILRASKTGRNAMAGSARDIQMRELKDTISELNKLIKTLQQTIEAANAREAALCQERDNLKEQMDYLTKRLFGASSEKGKCGIPGQLNLFNEAETAEDPVAALSEEALPSWEEPEAKPRKKRAANEERLKGLPVEQVFLDVPEEERICGVCGTLMETIGTEFVRRELKFIPAKVKVIEYYSVNYGCPKCRKEAVLPQIKKGKGGRAHRIMGWRVHLPWHGLCTRNISTACPCTGRNGIGNSAVQTSAEQPSPTGSSRMHRIFSLPCMPASERNCLHGHLRWRTKRQSRCCRNRGGARRHSPICVCSAVVKMRVRQSSFINTLQRALETMPWNSWKGTVDT